MLRSKKTVYQKERTFIFAYSNKRKTVKIAYRDKHFLPFSLSHSCFPIKNIEGGYCALR